MALTPAAPARAQSTARGAAALPSADLGDAIFPDLEARRAALEAQGWLLGGQATAILQGNAGFASPYRAAGSLHPAPLARNTFSADITIGRRLWQGAEVVVDAQTSQGFGISNSTGVAAFPNGEAFRLGTNYLAGYFPRAFFRQTIALSDVRIPTEELDNDPLRFREPLPRDRLTITAGKLSLYDIFDDNSYAHDPRTQFMNWALVGGAGVDFAADARGYTNGVAVELENGTWALRTGAFQVARRINGLSLDPQPFRGYQALAELTRYFHVNDRPGAVRLLYGYSRTRSQNWDELLAGDITDTAINPTGGYRPKHMLLLNAEQRLTRDLGAFVRLSWNDGRAQNWMFTEMDNAVSAGLSLNGRPWERPGDTVGTAFNSGGISRSHRRFLEAGGIGFITGDGRLTYGREFIWETYYDARLAPGINAAADYQLVVNPAYNRDRGPVSVFALRVRAAF
ncbi:carbohydrate porin [Roseomonas sp. NAR14]|uniref:Carbohydrate porin n=1 Tax=Roseomonas acroporae TaxID=2937791 RepID=A0A9X2BVK0_9PROT|nr:carbohydrate porin [Roseomonas acroporae]MCK8786777.1 carbohydrate porin [Roseomonas acroporae]